MKALPSLLVDEQAAVLAKFRIAEPKPAFPGSGARRGKESHLALRKAMPIPSELNEDSNLEARSGGKEASTCS